MLFMEGINSVRNQQKLKRKTSMNKQNKVTQILKTTNTQKKPQNSPASTTKKGTELDA